MLKTTKSKVIMSFLWDNNCMWIYHSFEATVSCLLCLMGKSLVSVKLPLTQEFVFLIYMMNA